MSSANGNGHALAVLDLPRDRVDSFDGIGRAPVDVAHAFEPRDPSQPWGLCRTCGFGEATHVAAVSPFVVLGSYRCPECVLLERPSCSHPQRPGEQTIS